MTHLLDDAGVNTGYQQRSGASDAEGVTGDSWPTVGGPDQIAHGHKGLFVQDVSGTIKAVLT